MDTCTTSFWPTLGEWIVFGAEILVAWVIYLELRHNREATFLQKAADPEANKSRRELYAIYFNSVRESGNLTEAPGSFNELIRSNPAVRKCCENQLSLFNELGLVYRKTLGVFPTNMVKVIPHATIFLWVFLKEHIRERREQSGPWFATPFMRFALESVKYAKKFDVPLYLHAFEPFREPLKAAGSESKSSDAGRDLKVTPADLERFEKEIRRELKKGTLWYERPWF